MFLAAIMVISVLAMPLAFAGGAAAAVDDDDFTANEVENVVAGASADQQDVSFDVNMTDRDDETIVLDYSTAATEDVVVIGASADTDVDNVSVSTDFEEDEVEVTVTNESDIDLGNVEIDVEVIHDLSDVDPAVNVPLNFSADEGNLDKFDVFDVSGVDVEDSSRAYEGQFIESTNDSLTTSDDIELIRDFGDDGDNEFIDVEAPQERIDENIVFFDTDGLETGESYSLVNASDDDALIGTVQLTANRYSADWDEDEVDNAGDTTVDVEIDANRGSYSVHVTSDDMDADDIFQVFEDVGEAKQTSDGVLLSDIRDGDFEGDFDGIDEGDYDFEFDMVDTTASDSSSITVNEGEDGDLAFADDSVDVTQGDVAEIEIDNVGDTDEGYLVIGGFSDSGYEAVVNITEIEEDSFTINFNTYLAGNDSDEIVSSDDDVEVELGNQDAPNQVDIDGILDLGDYDLSLGTSFEGDVDEGDDVESFIDDADEVGALFVEERNVGDMNLWTATSSNAGDLEDGDDIAEAIDEGLLTETDTIAFDDALVHQIELDGVGGFLAGVEDVDEDDLDEALLAAVDAELVDINVEQTDETRQSNRRATELNTSALEEDDISVIYEGGELFVTIESVDNDLEWTDARNNDRDIEDGDAFSVELEISDERILEEGDNQEPYINLDDEDEHLFIGDEEFTVEDRDGEFINLNDDDEIEVEADEEQTITAETNVAPGTEFTIRANGEGDARFVKTQSDLVVSTDGEIEGEFDFSDRDVDEEFTAQLRGGDLEGDRPEADGIIVESIEDAPEDDEDDVVDDEDDVVDDEDDVVDDEEDDLDDEDDVEDVDDETPGFGAIVALVALIGAALLAVRRQN